MLIHVNKGGHRSFYFIVSRVINVGMLWFSVVLYCLCTDFVQDSNDDVIKWKHFPRYWPFVRGIRQSPVNSPHKGQWRGALMFSLICASINDWVNNREAGDLRRCRARYDVIVITNPALIHSNQLDIWLKLIGPWEIWMNF